MGKNIPYKKYAGKELREVPREDWLKYFLFAREHYSLGGKKLFDGPKEFSIYVLEDRNKEVSLETIKDEIGLLRFKLGLRPLKELGNIIGFKETLHRVCMRKARKICGSCEKKCEKCPLRSSFETMLSICFKGVYPVLKKAVN